MKRFLGILLIALLMLPVLVQAQDATETPEPVVISWWANERGRDTAATRQLHYDLARTFESEHPGIIVDLGLFPSKGFATRVSTAIAAGQGPDVWYYYYSPDAAQQGFLQDLTPYVEASGMADTWFERASRRAVFNDKYYGVPRDAVSDFVAYNKDLFDAAGLAYPTGDWTVADYLDTAKILTDTSKDQYGLGGIEGGDGCKLWSELSFNLGANITSDDGKQVVGYLDTPDSINAMKWCLSLVTEDKVTSPPDMSQQFGEITFMSGKVGMELVSDWEMPAIQEQTAFKWGVVAPPKFDASSEQIPWADSYMYYMWNGSQHKDQAWQLMEWLAGPEAQKMAGVWSPNSPAVWQELGWDKDPVKSISYNQLINSKFTPNYLRSQFFFDCVYGPISDVRTQWIENGERDLDTLMKDAAQTGRQCLDDSYANLPAAGS